jgi:hypothetical protein
LKLPKDVENFELRQCVSLRKTGDKKLFKRDGLFVWFCHCASSLDHLVRPDQHVWWNRQANLLGCFQINDQLKLLRLL